MMRAAGDKDREASELTLSAPDGAGLSGEDRDTSHGDDIAHWTRVYEELLRFKNELIDTTVAKMARMPPEVRDYIAMTDLQMLQGQAARLQSGVDYWRRRATVVREEAGRAGLRASTEQ